MSVINSDPYFHLRRNLATSRVWAEAPVAFQPSLDLHPLSVRECWLCVHEPPHGAVPFLSYVLLWPFHALSCSKEVLPFQRAFPVLLSYRRLIMLSRSGTSSPISGWAESSSSSSTAQRCKRGSSDRCLYNNTEDHRQQKRGRKFSSGKNSGSGFRHF